MTRIKRFYRNASAALAEEGYTVVLDGRPVRTPARAPLVVPARVLAEAIATEWAGQDEYIRPHRMPLTQIASTAIDRVRPQRDAVVEALVAYARTDLLCYRATAPAELIERQARVWQPLLDWAALRFDGALVVTSGVVPVEQPAGAINGLRGAAADGDDFVLAALHGVTVACGSLVLALAVREGRLDAAGACAASELDEDWQAEQWGRDPEAEARRRGIRDEIHAAARFLALLKDGWA